MVGEMGLEGGRTEINAPLESLQRDEKKLWSKLESLLVRHAMKMAQRPAVEGPLGLLEAVEELREIAREIAEGIRDLTMIIRQEILLEHPEIAVDMLAARVDQLLKERIAFNFRSVKDEIPQAEK